MRNLLLLYLRWLWRRGRGGGSGRRGGVVRRSRALALSHRSRGRSLGRSRLLLNLLDLLLLDGLLLYLLLHLLLLRWRDGLRSMLLCVLGLLSMLYVLGMLRLLLRMLRPGHGRLDSARMLLMMMLLLLLGRGLLSMWGGSILTIRVQLLVTATHVWLSIRIWMLGAVPGRSVSKWGLILRLQRHGLLRLWRP